MIGQTVSHYRIIEKLGGGMGVVYKVEDMNLSRCVAIKIPPHKRSHHSGTSDRFEPEIGSRLREETQRG